MRSRGGASSALGAERAERERERAALLRHARDEAERSLQLAAALSARDTQLRHAREQLFEVSTISPKGVNKDSRVNKDLDVEDN